MNMDPTLVYRPFRHFMKNSMLGLLLWVSVAQADWNNLLLGRPSTQDELVERQGYALGYRESAEQAAWVCYELTAEEVRLKVCDRNDNFRPDPRVNTGSATLDDYRGSGYDRGHLAPSADMCWSWASMDESFFMSNMSPQLPGFNRGIWAQLEGCVRDNAVAAGALWVVTGPVLDAGLPTIGSSGVAVPGAYYKVLLDREPTPRMLAFLLPQTASGKLADFVVSVDQVEVRTGLDFFSALPDGEEKALEAAVHPEGWSLKGGSSGHGASASGSTAPLCKGLTRKGASCRNPTREANGYCHLHQSQAPGGTQVTPSGGADAERPGQCMAITRKGTRCSRRATQGGYCWQHAK